MTMPPQPGALVLTTFRCRNLLSFFTFMLLHWRLKRDVRTQAEGFLGVTLYSDRSRRLHRSISLWRDPSCVMSMGSVKRHIFAVHQANQWIDESSCVIYSNPEDWRKLLERRIYEDNH